MEFSELPRPRRRASWSIYRSTTRSARWDIRFDSIPPSPAALEPAGMKRRKADWGWGRMDPAVAELRNAVPTQVTDGSLFSQLSAAKLLLLALDLNPAFSRCSLLFRFFGSALGWGRVQSNWFRDSFSCFPFFSVQAFYISKLKNFWMKLADGILFKKLKAPCFLSLTELVVPSSLL
jgi:hypothetical protein